MIDVSQMRALSLDANTGRVKVAGGARNATVYEALRAPSLAVTHGRCKQVGVAGLTLGGGIGFNMRAHGIDVRPTHRNRDRAGIGRHSDLQ